MTNNELKEVLKFISKCPANGNWQDNYRRTLMNRVGVTYKVPKIPDLQLTPYVPKLPVKVVPNIYKDSSGIISVYYNNTHYKLNADVPSTQEFEELQFGALPIMLYSLLNN